MKKCHILALKSVDLDAFNFTVYCIDIFFLNHTAPFTRVCCLSIYIT